MNSFFIFAKLSIDIGVTHGRIIDNERRDKYYGKNNFYEWQS